MISAHVATNLYICLTCAADATIVHLKDLLLRIHDQSIVDSDLAVLSK